MWGVNQPRPLAAALETDPQTQLPLPTQSRWKKPLLAVIGLSLLPALALAYERVNYEQSQRTVALVMDYPAMKSQADRYGRDVLDLLSDYHRLGVNGVAVYEDVLGNWQNRGDVPVSYTHLTLPTKA